MRDTELQKYLENLSDSEDGFDDSDSDPDYEQLQACHDANHCSTDDDTEEDEIDIQVIDGHKTSGSSKSSRKKPLDVEWLKKNLMLNQSDLKFGPQGSIPVELLGCKTPYEFFSYFFGPEIKQKIVDESNLYAMQKNIANTFSMHTSDLDKFVGILVYSSVMNCSNVRSYWNASFGYEPIRSAMCLNDFERIRSNLHFTNNDEILPKDHPQFDRQAKVRLLIHHFNERFGHLPFEQKLSVDEQMCATKMSSYMKQYLPNKPHKWGFKLFVLCGMDGFAHKFEIFTGSGSKSSPSLEPNLGEAGNVVVRLCRNVPRDMNHIMYFDNYYTSIPLISYLAKEGIYSLGTVRTNRLRNCQLMDKQKLMKKEIPRGYFEERTCNIDGIDISVVGWKDNKPVTLLSSYVGAEPVGTISRFDKKQHIRVSIPCPKAVQEYNAHMGGVDLLDSLIGRYKISFKSRKWTTRLFYHFLDMAIINSWLVYKKVMRRDPKNTKILMLLEFRFELAEVLCKIGENSPKKGRPRKDQPLKRVRRDPFQSGPPQNVKFDQTSHWAIWKNKQARCKYADCKGFTKRFCEKCQVSLCDTTTNNCFFRYHNP